MLRVRLPRFHGALAIAAVAAAQALVPGAQRLDAAELLTLLPPTLGATELYASAPQSGLALFGYDVVSFYLDPRPRAGRDGQDVFYSGLAWRFASEANRAAFARDPAAFLPRIGGYDTAAAAAGDVIPADPRFFVVHEGRLYLFRTEAGRESFLNRPDLADEAETRWRALQAGLIKG